MAYEPRFGQRQRKLRVGRKTSFNNDSVDGSGISLIKAYTVAVDPASLAAQTGAETTVTVTGVTTDDRIICCMPAAALNAGLCFSARVSAADTVKIHVVNVTSGAIDMSSTNFTIVCARMSSTDF